MNIFEILFEIYSGILVATFEYKLVGVLFAMLCLFLLNYFITFRKASIEGVGISKKHKLLMSIIITTLTSPYFIFIDVPCIISDFNLY